MRELWVSAALSVCAVLSARVGECQLWRSGLGADRDALSTAQQSISWIAKCERLIVGQLSGMSPCRATDWLTDE